MPKKLKLRGKKNGKPFQIEIDLGDVEVVDDPVVVPPPDPIDPPPPTPAPAGYGLGVNLGPVNYYTPQLIYRDCVKQTGWHGSGQWHPQYADRGDWTNPDLTVEVDANGWPVLNESANEAAGTVIYRELQYNGPSGYPYTNDPYTTGDYVVSWDGPADALQFGFGPQLGPVEPGSPNLATLTVSSTKRAGIHLKIVRDGVKDLRILPPTGQDAADLFNLKFTHDLAPFGTLRFMDWQRTNDQTATDWADRPLPTDAVQTSPQGVCHEHIIELCNLTAKNPWICVPHLATDDYITSLATLYHSTLSTDLTLYIEYSNETWNGQFDQEQYTREQGMAEGLDSNEWTARHLWHAKRSVEVFDIFESVFGGLGRLNRVMGSQNATPWTSNIRLGAAIGKCDSLAVAPYLNIDDATRQTPSDQLTADALLDAQQEYLDTKLRPWITAQRVAADAHGVDLIAYEGGQHLVTPIPHHQDDNWTDLIVQANRHPRMGELYTDLLDHWQAEGGGLFCHFNNTARPGKWGCWGLKEQQYQDPETSPKWEAFVNSAT